MAASVFVPDRIRTLESIATESSHRVILGNIRITCPCDLYPLTPHFYIKKTWAYRGMHYFLNFALKHGLWVLVRTASLRRF